MFSYINGEITEKECDKVVVDVGGVGFELFCSDVTLSQCAVGECRRLYVYLQVKTCIEYAGKPFMFGQRLQFGGKRQTVITP